MKVYSIYIAPIILLFALLNNKPITNEKIITNSGSYFPTDNKTTLIYKSSFGESSSKFVTDGESTICSNEADNFKYRQTLIITKEGVYITKTYQYIKVLLLFKKEATFTYGKPLLRFPNPLIPGAVWKCEDDEYSNGIMNKVTVTGKVLDTEIVETKAGKFEALKLESVVEGSSNAKNRVTEWYAKGIGLIKAKIVIEGGGVMGTLRDILGYGTIEFELKEIRKQ
jgi:hypothetical protein